MSSGMPPEMSVVIFTPDTYETIRRTIRHLQRQTARDRLEILITAPSRDELRLDESELEPFLQWRVVEVGPVPHIAAAKSGAVRQASAPLVAFAEDHSYPDPQWAAALIQAHQEGWAAVGPVISNANPDSMTSWADLFLGFGPWVEPAAAGQVDRLPWHNSSYRRDLLLSYGASLSEMLAVESLLQSDLLARGYPLYLNPAARTSHVNISRLSCYLIEQFHGARGFAAYRAGHGDWSARRRLLYIAGAPLIPMVRLRRALREIRRCGRQRDLLPGILPALALGVTMCGAGEMMGCAFGAGASIRRKSDMETHRERHQVAREPQASVPE